MGSLKKIILGEALAYITNNTINQSMTRTVKHTLCSCRSLHVSSAIAFYSEFAVSCMKQNSEILTKLNIIFCINIHVYI